MLKNTFKSTLTGQIQISRISTVKKLGKNTFGTKIL